MDKENSKVEEVKCENVSQDKFGNIKFCKKSNNTKRVSKVIIFIAIAACAGALSSKIIVEKKFSEILQGKNENMEKYNLIHYNSEISTSGIAKVAEKVGPSVVGVMKKSIQSSGSIYESNGSGVIFSEDGYIVTNSHIITDGKDIKIKLPNRPQYMEAKLIGKDDTSDIAIIKIDAQSLPVAKFSDSSKVNVGDVAIAIGNPFGKSFPGNVSCGIISGFEESKLNGKITVKTFKTDAAINLTNSGGALCDISGEIIGINSIKLNHNKIEGIGFSVYSNEVKNIFNNIMKCGKCSKFNIGVNGKKVVSGENKKIKGIYVSEVIKESVAENAGIKPTDIIIELDGKIVSKLKDMDKIVQGHKLGDNIICKVWRNEKITNLTISLLVSKDNN